MDLSTFVFLFLAKSSCKYRYFLWACLGLSVGLILLSTSKTSLVLLLTILVLLHLYKALRWNFSWMLPFFIAVVLVGGCVATLFISNFETIVGALGRDATLTGRTDIWQVVLEKIGERPWLGYGYSGFWIGKEGGAAEVWARTNWEAPHSHNGFLDLCLDLGILGVLAFMVSFLTGYSRALTRVRLTKTEEGIWPLIYLSFMLLYNLSESGILKQNDIFWVLYVAVNISLFV